MNPRRLHSEETTSSEGLCVFLSVVMARESLSETNLPVKRKGECFWAPESLAKRGGDAAALRQGCFLGA
jgi:hypothetical protein